MCQPPDNDVTMLGSNKIRLSQAWKVLSNSCGYHVTSTEVETGGVDLDYSSIYTRMSHRAHGNLLGCSVGMSSIPWRSKPWYSNRSLDLHWTRIWWCWWQYCGQYQCHGSPQQAGPMIRVMGGSWNSGCSCTDRHALERYLLECYSSTVDKNKAQHKQLENDITTQQLE